jgi:peptide/nickel transport system ATP-binding protein
VEILANVGLSDPADRMRQFPHQLSGGIRQRVMIAAALLAEPRLMIADEPTTALDATTEAQIFEILATARRSLGGAMVFITHDIGSVARICERVAVLYGGELVESGPVKDVLERPAHPYTQALLECDPARIGTPARRLPTIPGRVPRPDDLPGGCIFAPRCAQAVARCHRERPRTAALGKGWRGACHLAAP